jgi:hypothetical protein
VLIVLKCGSLKPGTLKACSSLQWDCLLLLPCGDNMKWIINMRWNGMNWIYLAQDRDKWLAIAETIKFGFYKMLGIHYQMRN